MEAPAGTRITVSGAYDFEPAWLAGADEVAGTVLKRGPGQNNQPACVVELDEPMTATGDVRRKREQRRGRCLILELRYTGQVWEAEGSDHVERCESEPSNAAWSNREVGAWVESHATYRMAT